MTHETAPSGKWVTRHPASRHVAVVLEPIAFTVAFIPVRPMARLLEAHLALYHKKFADPCFRDICHANF